MSRAARTHYVHAEDGVRLALTLLEPEASARGWVLLVHGFSQNRHAFLEGHLPQVLTASGYAVALGELRGHGRSERPERWSLQDHLQYDLPRLAAWLREEAGARRLHYIGHSMGGLLGFASLDGPQRWDSVTGLATPLELGKGSPLVGLAAALVRPVAARVGPRRVPMDRFLGALSGPLSVEAPQLPLRVVQRVLALANPRAAEPEAIRRVLAASDPESIEVLRSFLDTPGRRGRAQRKALAADIRRAKCPLAVVVGGRDIFAPPASVAMFTRGHHAGPRRMVSLPRASHVDLTVGRDVARTVESLLPFLEGP